MLSDKLKTAVEAQLDTEITKTKSVSGGDINEAAHISTESGEYFVKWNAKAPAKMFEVEAQGLKLLASAKALRVPKVIAHQAATKDTPAFLLLEWLKTGRSKKATAIQLGEGLAKLHQQKAQEYGLDHANFIGSLHQPNDQTQSWPEFYGEQRIRAQMKIAVKQDKLSTELIKLMERLILKLPDLLPEKPSPALLHGDLWSGNVMTLSGGEPAIIDPAVYYGHREVELAFTELFGGFKPEFYDAYRTSYPLDDHYGQRKALYQLYPLMTHMNLFGGGYMARVETVVRHFVG